MGDDVEKRLSEAADTCIKCYDAWQKNKKEASAREGLMESLHELRKAAARLEIDVAISERDEMTQKPIPIPAHRSSNPHSGDQGSGNIREDLPPISQQRSGGGGKPPPRRRRSSGGGGGAGGNGGNANK